MFVWIIADYSSSVYLKCANSRKLKISFLRDFSTDKEDLLGFLSSTQTRSIIFKLGGLFKN